MPCITLLKTLDDTEGVQIVIEAQTVSLETTIEGSFTGVPKGRMPDVVYQGECLCEVFVEAKRRGYMACDLSDLDGVRQTTAKVIGGAAGKDLCLAGEAPKGARLHNAIAISLESKSVITGWRWIGADCEAMLLFAEDTAGMKIEVHCLRV